MKSGSRTTSFPISATGCPRSTRCRATPPGIAAQRLDDLQAVAQQHEDVAPREEAPHQREPRLALECTHERREGRAEVLRPEVAEPGAPARRREQALLVERRGARAAGPAR